MIRIRFLILRAPLDARGSHDDIFGSPCNFPETASDMDVAHELLVKHPAIGLPMHRKHQVWHQIQTVPLRPPRVIESGGSLPGIFLMDSARSARRILLLYRGCLCYTTCFSE
jgi:hypothetical protein